MSFDHQPLDLASLLSAPDRPPEWVIDGIAERQSVTYIHSGPGVGKSLVALEMCLSVAAGRPFLGRDTSKGTAIYIDNEMRPPEIRRRLRGFAPGPSVVKDLAYFAQVGMLLDDDISYFIQAVRKREPQLIVVDSFRHSFTGDENCDRATAAAIHRLDRVSRDLNAAVIVLGHDRRPGQDGQSSYRGSSNIKAQVDTMFHLTRLDDGRLMLDSTDADAGKNRSGLVLDRLTFRVGTSATGSTELLSAGPRTLADDIIRAVTSEMTSEQVAKAVRRGKQPVTKALEQLVEDGLIALKEDRKRKLYRPLTVLGEAAPL